MMTKTETEFDNKGIKYKWGLKCMLQYLRNYVRKSQYSFHCKIRTHMLSIKLHK